MNKIKIGLIGASGKMGVSIRKCLKKQTHFNPFIALSSKDCEEFSFSVRSLQSVEKDILQQVDVWVDFSNVNSISEYKYMTKSPIVSGVTGYSKKEIQILKNISKIKPFFWSANFSRGIWVMRQALQSLSFVSDFDFLIQDIHHNQKKDNPSGTALILHNDLEKIINRKVEIPIGRRLGGIFGSHEVLCANQSETIKIEHTALNREVFAEGALVAAKWIVNKKNGFYSMDELMKSKKAGI